MTDYSSHHQASIAEDTVAFLLSLRERGIRDIALLRAMEMVPRDLFAPRRFSDLARADISLPLSCGQTMTAPRIIANMLLALKIKPEHKVFEVGSGSGYVSAVLGRMAGHVVSVERYRTLALAASERIATINLSNVVLLPADGLAAQTVADQRFDRILLNGTISGDVPAALLDSLKPGGLLVGAKMIYGASKLIRITRREDAENMESEDDSSEFTQEILGSVRLPPLAHGVAQVL
ncbi:protein-L-isoaspartate O-methyltransferase family protein [Pseudochelatococcus sp. G4_1912]|uniref:protein-L-isoaspartate O-methyltransferase family protein n=1 Tax=Pseudochelatococcus sp. G4_1912 TaxID=3114288 RepID=UPI0039C5F9A0